MSSSLHAGPAWQGSVPKIADQPKQWIELLDKLEDREMHYGALASASRMLFFFSDLPSKEAAYKAIVALIDKGYPFNAKPYFSTGDIEPGEEDLNFANSYNFYKGLIAKEKNMMQWAEAYFKNVDAEKFPKLLLYEALLAYSKSDYEAATKLLKKILAQPLPDTQRALVKKTARTLARIYFEQQMYDKSLEIYENFLLKTNPINTSDWLEAAWGYYYQKKYDQALGMLYNLESPNHEPFVTLEKYELRALIYQGLCDTTRMQALIDTFETDWGRTLKAIKSGELLASLPALKTIFHPSNAGYYQNLTSLERLRDELQDVHRLPSSLQPLARYLYTTELQMLKRKISSFTDTALNVAATHLVTLSENLRFLKFDVNREQFSPESLFKSERKPSSYAKNKEEHGFEIHWIQNHDFWRDERNHYKAVIKNHCGGDVSPNTED